MKYKWLTAILLFAIIFLLLLARSATRFVINVDTTGKRILADENEEFGREYYVIINGEKIKLEVSKNDYICIIYEAFQNDKKNMIALLVRSWPSMMRINGLRLPNLLSFESDNHILLFRGKRLIYSRDMSKEFFIIKGWNEKGQLEIWGESGKFAINKRGKVIKIK